MTLIERTAVGRECAIVLSDDALNLGLLLRALSSGSASPAARRYDGAQRGAWLLAQSGCPTPRGSCSGRTWSRAWSSGTPSSLASQISRL